MRLLFLVLIGLLALGVGCMGGAWIDPALALGKLGYWGMGALLILAVFVVMQWWRQSRINLWRSLGWSGCGWIVAAWVLLITREQTEFKIVMDEPMLLSASMGMHVDRTPVVPRAVYELAGQREVQPGQMDKRPLLFPFLVSLLHDVLGYRVENAFLLNRALVLALLVLAWLAGRSLDPSAGGPLFLLWFCGWPLVAQNACGGGFEVLNLVLILAVFLAAIRYLKERNEANEVLLLAACLLLANTRYESVLYLFVFAGLWLWGAIRSRSGDVSWSTVFSPLLLLPYLWQRVMVASSDRYMELGERAASSTFGLGYVSDNLAHAWRFLTVPDPMLAGSPLFGGLGVLALVGLALVLIRREKQQDRQAVAPLVSAVWIVAGALAGFAVLMAYFWGTLDDPVASRLALPLIGAMGLALCAVRPHLLPSAGARYSLFGIMGLWIAGYALPVMNEHQYSQNNVHMRIFDWSRAVIARSGAQHPLVIGIHARIWTAYREPALTPKMTSMAKVACHLAMGTFDEVFVIQSLAVPSAGGAEAVQPESRLPDGVTLEQLTEHAFSPSIRVRISRVKSIDLERVDASLRSEKAPPVVVRDRNAG